MTGSTSQLDIIERQSRLADLLQAADFDLLALNPSPSLTYLTGLQFHVMERPIVVLFSPQKTPIIILPELEAGKTHHLSFGIQAITYSDDPTTWQAAFEKALKAAGADRPCRIGLEPTRLRVLEYRFLQDSVPAASFASAETALAELRICKGPGEIAAMRQAVQIAQQALLETLPLIRIGMSERELASELTLQLLRAGSGAEGAFAPIIAAGANGANPHYFAGEQQLTPGDLLVIDWGAVHDGYLSDLTRTFAVGEVEPELARIAGVVAQANAAGRAAARPGIPAGQVDEAARAVIVAAGYGPYFIHRTGHGLGREEHETPYIYAGNPQILQPGMTFTVEPGIYLPDRGGVRIEDDVAITLNGAESLSDLPRDLRVVGG